MKILHIIDTLALGGAQVVLKGIVENDRQNTNNVYVLRNTDTKMDIHPLNGRVVVSGCTRKYSIGNMRKLKSLINEYNPDIIHLHLPKSLFAGILLKSISKIETPVIYHEHGSILGTEKRGDLFYSFYRYLLKISSKYFEGYITISGLVTDSLRDVLGSDVNIERIYNFVDLERFKPGKKYEIRKEFGYKEKDFIVGFACRLVERKGWKTFLECADMMKGNSAVKFAVAGSGKDEDLMKKYIQEHKLGNVKMLGFRKDMERMYSTFDIFVAPAYIEPLGLTHIEAMACGTPVIVSDVPALNEVIDGRNGLLFQNKSASDLKRKIDLLLEDEKKRKLIVKNSKSFIKKFSVYNYLLELNNFYTTILGERKN
jgi:glycosyltransferase involved in cell wall biosynthesis